MGKASGKKKKLIQEGRADQSRDLKSSRTFASSQDSRKPSLRTKLLFMIFIILFSSVAAYFNALFNDFVYDDKIQVLENHWIKDIKYIPEIFSKSVWSFQKGEIISNYYRPLMHIIYMLNYYIFGLKPWGFHLVNILFHAGVSILVFIIVLRLLRESQPSATTSYLFPSFMAAMLFVTHPIHTEAVTWIAGLPDLSFTFFFLLSFYFYIRSTGDNIPYRGAYLLSVAFFFLAALCKEPALTLLIVLIAYDSTFRKSGDRISSYIMRYVPYLIVAGVYFILRFHALGDFAPEKRHAELSTYQYFINVFPLFMQYLEKLVLPINLNAFYVLHPIFSLFEAKGILSLMIAVAFVVLGFIAMKKNRMVFFSLSLIAVPLLPALYIPALGENTFAERYLYLPSIGFIFIFTLILTWAKVNRPKVAVSLIVVSTIVIGLYSLGTVSRNTIWRDNYMLYADMVRKSPDGVIPRNNFGVQLLNKGKIDEAIEQCQIALRLNPDYADAHHNLGLAFFRKRWIDKAIEQFQIALELNPNRADAHNGLGTAFFNKGWTDKAIEQFQVALKLNPNLVDAHNGLGAAFLNKGWIDKAIEQFQVALKLNPDYADAHNNLGAIFSDKGWIDKAIEQYQVALELNPDYADAHNNLGNALFKKGQIDKAIEQYQVAIRLNPTNSTFRSNLDIVTRKKQIR